MVGQGKKQLQVIILPTKCHRRKHLNNFYVFHSEIFKDNTTHKLYQNC